MRGRLRGIKRARTHLLRIGVASALVAVFTATSAGMASAGVIGPDVSSHNHDSGAKVDWSAVHHRGKATFAFVKATEGGGYSNPAFSSDFALARRHGLYRGAYHFARPGGKTNPDIIANATGQANQFLQATGNLAGPGNLPPVLDLEDAGTLGWVQMALWTHTWLNVVGSRTGRIPIVYTYGFFWKDKLGNSTAFVRHPLWLASYGVSRPVLVGGWSSYTFWQFTDAGRMDGFSRGTDLSIFNGSLARLKVMTDLPATAKAAAAQGAAAQAAAAKAAVAQAAAAAAAVEAAAVEATASTASSRFRHTTPADAKPAEVKPADSKPAGPTTSRSSVRSWLGVHGLDGSRPIARL